MLWCSKTADIAVLEMVDGLPELLGEHEPNTAEEGHWPSGAMADNLSVTSSHPMLKSPPSPSLGTNLL